MGDGARERDGFDLQVEPAVAFFIAPVGVQSPQEAVLFAGAQGVFAAGAGGVDLFHTGAAGDAVAVLHVEPAEVDVVGGVHDDGDDVALADAHPGLHVVAVLGDHFGLHYLRGEVLGVGVEVAHEPLEVGGGGSGGEGCSSPVVEECAGEVGTGGGCELLDDLLALPQTRLCVGDGWSEEGVGGAMLLGEAGLYRFAVGVEGLDGSGGGLCHESAGCVEEEQQAAEYGHLSRGSEGAFLHGRIVPVSPGRSNARKLTRGRLFLTVQVIANRGVRGSPHGTELVGVRVVSATLGVQV